MGVLERGKRDKDNETDLKEEGVIEMSTTVLHSRAAPSLCIYLPLDDCALEYAVGLRSFNRCVSSLSSLLVPTRFENSVESI